MHRYEFVARVKLEATAEEAYCWHARDDALELLTPSWEPVEVESKTGTIEEEGSLVTLRLRLGPFRLRWVSRHHDCIPGRQFCDSQVKGPFALWQHKHSFTPNGEGSILEDRIEYALPGGRAAHWVAGWFVRRKLKRLFEYRHQVTAESLAAEAT
ncbi:MAG: ligand-binding SRPBCC domain-containing protein [Planctomycetota bacterium]|jgi:ligand-binding SRPBCC domain-containing protein